MKSRDNALVLLRRARNDMHVGLEPRAHNAARIAIAGASVECEILRTDLQHHLVFFETHARREFHRISQIVIFDLPLAPEFVEPAAVDAGDIGAADAD